MVDLRAERERAGLSQARLAELVGIAASNLSAYESGARSASPAMVERIRRAMIRPSERLRAHRDDVAAIVRRNGGRNPRLFGSVALGTDTPASDIDILVEVAPEDAWTFVTTAREIEELLGVRIDVVSEGASRASTGTSSPRRSPCDIHPYLALAHGLSRPCAGCGSPRGSRQGSLRWRRDASLRRGGFAAQAR